MDQPNNIANRTVLKSLKIILSNNKFIEVLKSITVLRFKINKLPDCNNKDNNPGPSK